jgi:hypothetical protein
MSNPGLRAVLVFFAIVLSSVAASADDWVAQKLRGAVLTLVGGSWVQVHRGDVVPDGQPVRTQNNGHVTLVRGAEMVDVRPNSQIEIVDRDGRQFTTIRQLYGTVEIEAEVRNVQHFAVVNRHLAAVVKGTHFVVKSSDRGAEVAVSRGKVAVQDTLTGETVQVPAGHAVTTSAEAPLVLDGSPPASVSPASDVQTPSLAGDASDPPPAGDDMPSVSPGVSNTGDGTGPGSQDNNGSGPGNNGNGNAYGHDNGNGGDNGHGNGNGGQDNTGPGPANSNGKAYGHDK